jgi:hypothetical protein
MVGERKPRKRSRGLEVRKEVHGSCEMHGNSEDFFGLDIESMSPQAQAVTGVVTGGVILLAAALLILFTELWWLIFIFGWSVIPAFGFFVRGVAGLAESRTGRLPEGDKEQELLEALSREGELSAAQAAMETSLTVAGAEEIMDKLARGGHLEARVRGGGLFYALWEGGDSGQREVEER